MIKKKFLKDYCSGCGLCASIADVSFVEENGFVYPENISDECSKILSDICPFSNIQEIATSSSIWGDYLKLSIGYAKDPDIRKKASSGGATTALACYLLENKIVDGIIQIGQNGDKVWQTQAYCSETTEDVIMHMGSRYAQSAPLINIEQILNTNKKYAFIGKPCDIRALRNYQRFNAKAKENIIITLSFFCAGIPSDTANVKLLNALGINMEDCVSLQYRGNGWPGLACAKDKKQNEYKMSYSDSWGKILGRDIKKCCKFCMDGIGEAADVSCADAWYLKDNYPDFEEHDGRNLIFARSELGLKILTSAIEFGKIVIEQEDVDADCVRLMQPSQYDRKATMGYKVMAMRLLGRQVPKYKLISLLKYSKDTTLRRKIDIFGGTVSRIFKRKI